MSQLITTRLLLRPLQDDDLDSLSAIHQDIRVMQILGGCLTREQTQEYINYVKQNFVDHGFGRYAMILKDTSELIGFVGGRESAPELHFSPSIEIGWRLAYDHWGKGLATEGARAAIDDLFRRHDIKQVVAYTSAHNEKSKSVMKKLGMTTDPRENFKPPKLSPDDPLNLHVLYRLNKQ